MLEPPPSLQTLVIAFGSYPEIPEAAWARFNAAMADWKERSRHGELKPVDLVQRSCAKVASLALDGAEAVTLNAEELPEFIGWAVKAFNEAVREAEAEAHEGTQP